MNILDFGAKGDHAFLNTTAIQSAIDRCAEAGGGTVVCPAGNYLTGTLVYRSHVTLHLEAGCTLWGSTDLADYPEHVPAFRSYTDEYTRRSLIYAEDVENIGLTGAGEINGNGRAFPGPYLVRPYLMRFISCRRVYVAGVTLRDSGMWMQHYLACDDVRVENISVYNREANSNNDGIDIDSCHRFIMSGCHLDALDDVLCLKSTSERSCQDVVVTNCVLTSLCNGIKLGTESVGGFQNIVITNCSIYDTRLAGIALETVDGGILERVVLSNITMDKVGAPIFLRRGARLRPYEGMKEKRDHPGVLRDVVISNVVATHASKTGCALAGLPGYPIENVTLRDINLSFDGGGTARDAERSIDERPATYPEYSMFGTLPAYGFYVRHARGITLDNVRLRYEGTDARPALVCDDVADLALFALHAQGGPDRPLIRARDLVGALISGCRLPQELGVFLRLEGKASADVSLIGNELGKAKKPVELASGVAKSAVGVK